MDDTENQVQKYLINFCKYLPVHVDIWKSVLQQSIKPLQTLINLWEQHRHVRKAKLTYMDNFDEVQATLIYQISNRIEEEIINLKELIDKLSKSSNDLKNRLLTLERSTLNLDWEKDSLVIRGNGTQPSLTRLLQEGLSFLSFFSKNARNISDNFKMLSLDDEKSIKNLKESFNVDLDQRIIASFVALTQYVDNEKAVL